jgi:hypothetical protein
VLILSDETALLSFKEVTGKTEMPSSSIKKGNSLVACAEPRYLTIRNLRVEI